MMKTSVDSVVVLSALHYASTDHLIGREHEMITRAAEYLLSIHGRSMLLDDPQVKLKVDTFLACLCASRIEGSVTVAIDELKQALADAAARHAAADIEREQCAAVQAAAIAAYQAQQQRCDYIE